MSVDEYALTTRETVHVYRIANGEKLNTTPDTNILIDNLINAVSKRFESFCDRKLLTRTFTEYYDGMGYTTLYPTQYPVTSVTALYDDSAWVWGSDTLVSGTTYRIANDNSIVFNSSSTGLGDYKQNVKLVYVAGYETTPYDLELACVHEILRAMERLEEISISEKRSNDFMLKYIVSPFLESTKLVLERYKRKGAF